MDLASKLSKKLRDSPKAPFVPVAPVKVDNAVSSPPSPSSGSTGTRPPTHSQLTRSSPLCIFCGKRGHKFLQCFQRKKQAAKEASRHLPPSSGSSSAHAATSQPSSHHSVAPSKNTRDSRASHAHTMQLAPPQPVPKYCHIHEYCNHTTEECYTILRLKHNQVATAGLHKPSGEASRQPLTNPP